MIFPDGSLLGKITFVPSGETFPGISCWRAEEKALSKAPSSGGLMAKLTSGIRDLRLVKIQKLASASAITPAVARAEIHRRRTGAALPRVEAAAPGAAVLAFNSTIHFKATVRSPADCHRSSGSLARHFPIKASRFGGVAGCHVETGIGSRSRIAPIKPTWLLAAKA